MEHVSALADFMLGLMATEGGEEFMAKTKTSTYGRQRQKIVPVRGYLRNGHRVRPHRRSTPN